ncbi:MAG: hypothetical protein ABIZ72_10135 [Candidatus Limnocylindrales bacterium]
MDRSQLRRLVAVAATLLAALALFAPAVRAKEGVEVTLAAPISRDAQPGDVVAVFFTLGAISDTGSTPLRGTDAYLRLYGPTGARTEATGVEQEEAGLYRALIAIPAGGAARAEFGIHGAAVDAAGKATASDIVWPYDGILVAAAAPAPVAPRLGPATGATTAVEPDLAVAGQSATAPSAPAPSLDLRLVAAIVLSAAAGGASVLVLGRRRRAQRSLA